MGPTRIAVSQLCSLPSKAHNYALITRLASEASSKNASMLFLPEVCSFMPSSSNETLENAEPYPDAPYLPGPGEEKAYPTLSFFSSLAASKKLWISAGSVHESSKTQGPDGKARVYNTGLLFDPTGTLRGKYRKVHLFSIDTPAVRLSEAKTTLPGDSLHVVGGTPMGSLGMAICYDLRFPYLSSSLRSSGATTLIYPSAFTVPTGVKAWETLLRARAIETQCFIVASAQVGEHWKGGRRSYGHSLVVGPDGSVLADAGGYDSVVEGDVEDTKKDLNLYVDVGGEESVHRERNEILQVERHTREDVANNVVFS